MANNQIHLYYKNVTSEIIGEDHGIKPSQFKELARITSDAVEEVNRQRDEGQIPYRDLPYREDYPQQVRAIASQVRDQFDNFVVLGIGGSALGNIALQTALNPYMYNMDEKQRKGSPRLFVFDNVDPMQLSSFLDWIEPQLDKTVFNVISKSGRTAETASQFMTIRTLLKEKLGPDSLKKHIIATTDTAQGTMRKITDDEGYQSLVVPDGVGGRFSVLSPVGLLSAAVCGIDIEALLDGARQMDEKTKNTDVLENPAALNAAINWTYYNRGKPISVMMPYSYHLKDLSDWYRQLWAESLGKTTNIHGDEVFVGPTPVKALGTTDQHSQVQLYREGPNDKLFTFLQVKEMSPEMTIGENPPSAPELDYLASSTMAKLFESEKIATEYALAKSLRPSMTVLFDAIDASTVGQFIYLFEVTTSIAGVLFEINAYDQPAVELGKEATFALMGRKDFVHLADAIEPFNKIDRDFLV